MIEPSSVVEGVGLCGPWPARDKVIYIPSTIPQRPIFASGSQSNGLMIGNSGKRVGYQLLSLTADRDANLTLDTITEPIKEPSANGLWDRRADDRITSITSTAWQAISLGDGSSDLFGHSLFSNGCKANLPWGWKGGNPKVSIGRCFLDPAGNSLPPDGSCLNVLKALDIRELADKAANRYISNVFLQRVVLSKTRRTINVPVEKFTCTCAQKLNNITNPEGLEHLAFGATPYCTGK